MKTNLSSQIKLDRIPKEYYRPANAFEHTALTRFEKLPTDIFESSQEGAIEIANEIASIIKNKQKDSRKCVLALTGGNQAQGVYEELVRLHKYESLSFANVVVFNVCEFYPLQDQSKTIHNTLDEQLFKHVDINSENIYSPNSIGERDSVYDFCLEYEKMIDQNGGLDLALLSLGESGSIGFNESGSQINSQTRLILLDSETRKNASKLYNTNEDAPSCAITMGVNTLMKAKRVILMAWGENKSNLVKSVVEGNISETLPATYLQQHHNAKLSLDLSAAEQLTRLSNPWLVTSCVWDDKIIRRAIVWLCKKTGKPILKLTNKDYTENSLSELVALFGSAYNVNIKVFNELQHTITGWPGGKPNSDDTYRPERATPFPKKVIVFSPHPDDDVISMGGTLKRLVDQNHDVYVAYETSGNIAVGDEEVKRFSMFMDGIVDMYNIKDEALKAKLDEIHNDLSKTKTENDIDTLDIREIKGLIRRGEARTACNYMGVKADHVNFLNLPFYETGTIKKGDLSEKDIAIVKALIEKIKPDQIFVAGDLADPHGTHKVCLDAVLAAIDEVKEEQWLKDCRIWMYRGAWAEWEVDHIEMAVPLSPEELRSKRNSILKHQSQMESAPFLGNDERLFWQRSEDRNRATAELYHQLGLASYEAIEAFVQYHPL
ncbi:MAG: glucosamine-6-phosphate deaminase [Bacteroidales bacterium]|nr:glucosamine-6-phosphate deaminase [Bacteroidales bacterium]